MSGEFDLVLAQRAHRHRDRVVGGHVQCGFFAASFCEGSFCVAQSQPGQPLSKMIFHSPEGSRRHIEVKVPMRLPSGENTGPVLSASSPLSCTSTVSGAQLKG